MLRRFRRDLHRIPELDYDLPETLAYVEGVLGELSCELVHPCESCACAYFAAGADAHDAIAIRSDMDALPIEETTGAAFASEHAGRMHACGHDAHMAMALAAAVWVDSTLHENPDALAHNVLFVFQPAEETTGGAKRVCESGVFERFGVSSISDSTYGLIFLPARSRRVPVRFWHVRAKPISISTAKASISQKRWACAPPIRTMRRSLPPVFWSQRAI